MNHPVVILPAAFRLVDTPLIRLGNEFDGGYVVSKPALDHSNHLLSFGLCTDWTFEVDYLHRKGDQPDFGGIDKNDYPNVIEVSYIAKRLLSQVKSSAKSLPLKELDSPNNRKALDYRIQFESSSNMGFRSAG